MKSGKSATINLVPSSGFMGVEKGVAGRFTVRESRTGKTFRLSMRCPASGTGDCSIDANNSDLGCHFDYKGKKSGNTGHLYHLTISGSAPKSGTTLLRDKRCEAFEAVPIVGHGISAGT